MLLVIAIAVAVLALAAPEPTDVLAQSGGTLRVQPSKTQVNSGETFKVDIVQETGSATLGAQGTIYFDASLFEILSLEAGPQYADAQLFAGISPQTNEEAIAEANGTGALITIATFWLPGTGSVSPGNNVAFSIAARARATAGTGQFTLGDRSFACEDPITLTPSTCTDPHGLVLDPPAADGSLEPVTVVPGTVSIGAGGAAPAGTTPTPTVGPSGSGTPKPSGTKRATRTPGGSESPGAGSGATFSISPTEVEAEPGDTFTFQVIGQSSDDITGAQLNLEFDRSVATVTKIEAGEDWEPGKAVDYSETVERANISGEIAGLVIEQKPDADPIPSGVVTLFTITMLAGGENGESPLTLSSTSFLDLDGEEVPVSSVSSGTAIIGEGDGGGGGGVGAIAVIGGGILLIGALGGGGAYAYRNMRRKRWDA